MGGKSSAARKKGTGAKSGKPKTQIDPNLSQALESAGDNGTVEAVLMFHKPDTGQLQRQIAKISSGEKVETNYFPNLGSVAVRATGRVVKKLLRQPGLAVAALNRA